MERKGQMPVIVEKTQRIYGLIEYRGGGIRDANCWDLLFFLQSRCFLINRSNLKNSLGGGCGGV